MTLPLIISVLVAGGSTLFPPKTSTNNGPKEQTSSGSGFLAGNQVFLTGIGKFNRNLVENISC